MIRGRRAAAFLCAAAVMIVSGCGEDAASSAGNKETESKTQTEKIIDTCIIADSNFETYVSNTYLATGNNFMLRHSDNTAYRAYIPLEEYGELEYAFYFSNTVDSTYDNGARAYVGQQGGAYTISSACVYDGGTGPDDTAGEKIPVTFAGGAGREVAPGDTFWSDPVTIDIPEGHYLVWEWTLTGDDIPCIKMSNLTSSGMNDDPDDPEEEFAYTDEVPLPVYIGAKRDVKGRVTAIGDSITQGCMTDYMTFEFWAARIAKELGSDYAFYNAGLGWSRASDCAQSNNWLGRALNCDYAIVAFGTNDIGSGAYGAETGDNADDINTNLRSVLEQFEGVGAQTILFNSPPQDYTGALEDTRVTLNELEKATAESTGAEYFDFAGCLSTEDDPSAAVYGGHPNAEGGAVVCEKFMEQFGSLFGKVRH